MRGEIAEVTSLNPLKVRISEEDIDAKAPPELDLEVGDKVKVTKFKDTYYVIEREED